MKGLHHVHLRKRAIKELEPFPARSFWLRVLDRVVLTAGVIGPLTTIPQIYKIYTTHDASGVSLLTWLLPAILDIPWIVYGFAHGERPIVITYTLWLVANLVVALGVVLYG